MAATGELLELGRLGMAPGEGRRLAPRVALAPLAFGGEAYRVAPVPLEVGLELSRTTSPGWALRLRLEAELHGPCARCLEPAAPTFAVDSREVHQPGGGEELASPYVDGDDVLDVGGWARDALVLALPVAILCRPDCAGLCPVCGIRLQDAPGHAHPREPDARWAKLSELRFDGPADGDAA